MYDLLSRVTSERTIIDGHPYSIGYTYDSIGNITQIQYPDQEVITYTYNELDQLTAVSEYADHLKDGNFTYDPAGNLISLSYNNQTTTTITPEAMSRPEEIKIISPQQNSLLNLNYAYDPTGNVTRRCANTYTYDDLDRLKTAEIDGTFMVDTPVTMGYAQNDYFINARLDYALEDVAIDFDYAASTIGLSLGSPKQVGRIELIPEVVDHRIIKQGIKILYHSELTGEFEELASDSWVLDRDPIGKLIITFKSAILTTDIKIHSNYDDRNIITGEIEDMAEFTLAESVRVYGRYNRTRITYDYDSVGNRIAERYTDVDHRYDVTYTHTYYAGSNRLKSRTSIDEGGITPESIPVNGSYLDGILRFGAGERMAYDYDTSGNLIEKGNSYTFIGEEANYDTTSQSATYWKYDYSSRNRLIDVWKNDQTDLQRIARYWYDSSGQRFKVEASGRTIYHIYNYLGQELYEVQLEDGKTVSYVYALGRIIGKKEESLQTEVGEVAGEEAELVEEKYYYHHNNLGSTVLMTDSAGKVVFKQDYDPFGRDLYPAGVTPEDQKVSAGYKYTGQSEDADIGLYYYNARYYDPEVGRFTREDEYQGELGNPQTLNLYVYTVNNPLKYVDPSGHMIMPSREWFVGGGGYSGVQEYSSTELYVYTALKTSINSFIEIGEGIYSGFQYRNECKFDSLYNLANYVSIGILDAIWSPAKERASKLTESPYDFANWLTFGTVDMVNEAINPEDPFSADHWMNSFGLATMIYGNAKAFGYGASNDVLLSELDEAYIKQALAAVDDRVEVVGEAGDIFLFQKYKQTLLKEDVLSNARQILNGENLWDIKAINKLTENGSNIEDWAKMSSSVYNTPYGRGEFHFYQNKVTGEISHFDAKLKIPKPKDLWADKTIQEYYIIDIDNNFDYLGLRK